ncbi:MAG: TetR family transcriptional regulator C-terminal domain-containing protein [Micropruina sp.]|nr:TetR family transcriptional regulator C-terminal domain-containing protein [Micropruina sp.]
MPRVVDHRQRRDELIAVVWQLIVDDGLPGITIRRVAARSGWSSGAVRHYLPTREAILEAAAHRVGEVFEQRIRRAIASAQGRDIVVQVLHAMLPADDSSRRASLVWLAFVGQAASDRSIADAQGILYRDLHELLVGVLDHLGTAGDPPLGGSAAVATELQALLDGLTVHVLLDRVSLVDAQQVLRTAVDRLLG